jgi:hypothetical protein
MACAAPGFLCIYYVFKIFLWIMLHVKLCVCRSRFLHIGLCYIIYALLNLNFVSKSYGVWNT